MVYIFLANGFEDVEAIQPRDLLLRAGIKVTTVGVGAKTVKSAFGLTVTADITEDELNLADADAVVFPGGMPGVETRGVLMYTYGVAAGRISAERMVEVLSQAPAKLYGAFPRKGQLAEGADADIVVYDPNGTSRITAKDQIANVDYAPYEGFEVAGRIAQVWLRGTLAVDEGKVLEDRGGQFIARGKSAL